MERTTSWHAEVEGSFSVHFVSFTKCTVYSGYSGHIYSGHSDKVATFPGTKYIYSFIFRSDIVAKVATISSALYNVFSTFDLALYM